MESINEAVILIGIQATGKSEFYKNKFADTHMRINLDMLKTRNELSQAGAKVPAGAITGTHSKLELPSLSEGFDYNAFIRGIWGEML